MVPAAAVCLADDLAWPGADYLVIVTPGWNYSKTPYLTDTEFFGFGPLITP